MNKSMPVSSWKRAFKQGFERKYIELVIYSYQKVLQKLAYRKPWENTGRNMLLEQMRKNKIHFGITFNIASEAGVYDENYKDTGRIDICCYLSPFEEQYIAFECKRFLKKNIIPSYIRDEYYGEGIRRFESNTYTGSASFGGMIVFLEEGDFPKLQKTLLQELPQYTFNNNIDDISMDYNHKYVFQTIHGKGRECITLIHILLDFTRTVST